MCYPSLLCSRTNRLFNLSLYLKLSSPGNTIVIISASFLLNCIFPVVFLARRKLQLHYSKCSLTNGFYNKGDIPTVVLSASTSKLMQVIHLPHHLVCLFPFSRNNVHVPQGHSSTSFPVALPLTDYMSWTGLTFQNVSLLLFMVFA